MGAGLAAMAAIGTLLSAVAGTRLFGLGLDRLAWAVPAYLAGGTAAGAAAGIVEPWLASRVSAYAAGVVLSLPLAVAVRLVLRGAAAWEPADTFVLAFLALALGGPLGVSFWADGRGT